MAKLKKRCFAGGTRPPTSAPPQPVRDVSDRPEIPRLTPRIAERVQGGGHNPDRAIWDPLFYGGFAQSVPLSSLLIDSLITCPHPHRTAYGRPY